jgi:putative transport protein
MQGFFTFPQQSRYLLPFLVVGPVDWIGRASIKGYGLGIVAAAIVVGAAISVTASLYVQSRLTVLDVILEGKVS